MIQFLILPLLLLFSFSASLQAVPAQVLVDIIRPDGQVVSGSLQIDSKFQIWLSYDSGNSDPVKADDSINPYASPTSESGRQRRTVQINKNYGYRIQNLFRDAIYGPTDSSRPDLIISNHPQTPGYSFFTISISGITLELNKAGEVTHGWFHFNSLGSNIEEKITKIPILETLPSGNLGDESKTLKGREIYLRSYNLVDVMQQGPSPYRTLTGGITCKLAALLGRNQFLPGTTIDFRRAN